jgi:hypothetical protein
MYMANAPGQTRDGGYSLVVKGLAVVVQFQEIVSAPSALNKQRDNKPPTSRSHRKINLSS